MPVFALLAALAATSAAAGEVYKWTDEKGVVHYTDAPPEGRDFERRKAATPPPRVSGNESAEADPAPQAQAEPKPAAGSAVANCEAARRNVENIERFPKVTMDRDGDGKPEVLTPEEREQELKRNQALISIYCPAEESQ